MRLRTRSLPLQLIVLCTLLLSPLSTLQPAPATEAVAAANAIEDTFTRANQTGWGTSTNPDGVPNVAWGLDGDGTKSYVTISSNTGSYGYQGSTNVVGIAAAGSTPYNGGDDLVRFAVSAVGHVTPYVVQNACADKSCYYGARLHTSQNKLELAKRSGGGTSILASVPFTATANTFYWMRLDVVPGTSTTLQARIWADGTPEPGAWMVSATDSSPLAANVVGTGGSWDVAGSGESIRYACYAYVSSGLAAPCGNTIEDTFTRANQTGWGTSTNPDGVPNVAWGLDGDGTKSYVTISNNNGVYGYQGSTNVVGIASSGSTTYNGGDSLVKFQVSAVGHATPYVVQNACSDKSCYYGARLHTSQNKLELAERSGGGTNILAAVPFTPTANTYYWLRLDVIPGASTTLRARIWAEGTTEPTAWMVTATDSTPLAANYAGTGGSWDLAGSGESIQYACYAFVTGGLASPCPAAQLAFSYGDFASVSGLALTGTAGQTGTVLRLTDAINWQGGSAFYTSALSPTPSFHTQFRFSLHDSTSGVPVVPADGIAFVLQGAGPTALGRLGEGLGYGGITPSVEVEFDTFLNSWDPNANHVALTQNGEETTPLALATPPFNLYGGPRTAWIDYNAATQSLLVYVDPGTVKPAVPLLSATINIPGLLGGPAYVGFTGATGADNSVQDLLSWQFASTSQFASTGMLAWHAHKTVRLSDGLSAGVDLYDGHVDVAADALALPARGPDLALGQVWDSALAQAGLAGSAGQGWQTSLTPSMGGVLTSTVSYTDATGALWVFPYTGALTATAPYTAYQTPAGLPWALSTAPTTATATPVYTLTQLLSGETLAFDAQGRYLSDTDAYGNQDLLSYGTGASGPISATNSGGRVLSLAYSNGLLGDVQSPLWRSSGGAQGQHVTYGYNGSGQLTTLTRGAGTTDALTTTFGYSGTQLISVTTPYTQATHTWTLGYDTFGRLVSLTSPISGTAGQAGYTPAYTTTFSYNGATTQVVDGAGSSAPLTTTYTLSPQGEPLTVMDGLNHGTSYQYDQDHDVTRVTDADNHTTYNYYQYVGPNGSTGLITQTVRPALTSYLTVTDPITTTYRYDPATNDLLEVDRVTYDGITQYGYDAHHSVVTTTELLADGPSGGGGCLRCPITYDWRGRVTQYDAYGERIATIDGRGVDVPSTTGTTATVATLNNTALSYTTHFSYTPLGDLAGQSTPPIVTTLNGLTRTAPVTTSYSYDADGEQTAVTSANGNTTTYGYDHLGRQVQQNLPAVRLWNSTGAITLTETTQYDGDGNLVKQVDGAGAVTTDSYDPLGREVAETNPVGGTSLITYTAAQQVAAQDPQGNVTRSSYDPAGRLVQTTDPLSGTVQYQYDNVGNTTAITSGDAGGAVTTVQTRQYDAQNQVISATVSGPGTAPQTTQTGYDADGHVAEVQQPNGDLASESYDRADQHIDTFVVTAGGSSTSDATYAYDLAGNVDLTFDADGRAHASTLDGANREVQSTDTYTYTPALTTTVSYDPDGTALSRMTQTAGLAQTASYTQAVNADDWPITTTDIPASGQQLATAYGYDGAGQPRTQTILNGLTPITNTLNAEGLVTATSESLGGTPYTSAFAYNANDLPITTTLNSGTTQAQEVAQYDKDSRLTVLQATGPATATAPLSSTYSYGYNAVGWTTGLTSTLNGVTTTQVISHDALGRVTGVQSGSSTQQFIYDGNGNLTQAGTNGVTTTYAYNNNLTPNEVLTVSVPGQLTTYYGYDTNGDVTSITNTSTISTGLSYDSHARLVGVTLKDGTSVSLSYNSAGRRAGYVVSKPGQPTLTERFQYRGDELGQAVVVTGTTTYTDTYLYTQDGLPLELLRQQNGTTSRYWYVLDGRGNVVALTSITGTVVDRYAYDVWGALTSVSESVPQRLRYAGYWYDQELGWYWVRVRLYDPSLKRWLQPDPSQQDGVRTYVYVGDDPIDTTDPSGMDANPPGVPGPTPNPVSTPTLPTATPTPSAGSGGGRITIQVSIQGGVPGNGDTGDGKPPRSDDRRFLRTIGAIARHFRVSVREAYDAIHAEKPGEVGGGAVDNPDIVVDKDTGQIYPVNPDGSLGDAIGNIHDGLASDRSKRKKDRRRGRDRRRRGGEGWSEFAARAGTTGAVAGGGVVVIWWVGKALSPACGPAAPVCAVVL